MPGCYLVDSPGYGFAMGEKKEIEKWGKMMNFYFKNSYFINQIIVLIDSEHGFKQVDNMIIELLNKYKKTFAIVFTKCDKINKNKKK